MGYDLTDRYTGQRDNAPPLTSAITSDDEDPLILQTLDQSHIIRTNTTNSQSLGESMTDVQPHPELDWGTNEFLQDDNSWTSITI